VIIYHKTHVGGFTGAHIRYWPTQPLNVQNTRSVPVVAITGVTMTAVALLEKTFSVDSTMDQVLSDDSLMETTFTEDSKLVIP